jgi:hypothetical protein
MKHLHQTHRPGCHPRRSGKLFRQTVLKIDTPPGHLHYGVGSTVFCDDGRAPQAVKGSSTLILAGM